MKYIRTKDGRIKNWKNDIVVKDEEIIKQADTIEELCDEFVIKAYIDSYPQIYHSVDLKELNEFREKDTIVYGAIWIDKGLIYVAKMNEKGELELL